jgi:hypothetical protein
MLYITPICDDTLLEPGRVESGLADMGVREDTNETGSAVPGLPLVRMEGITQGGLLILVI